MMELKDREVIHKILDSHAIEAGRKVLFASMFRADSFAIDYCATCDKTDGVKKTLREFTRNRINFDKMPDDVTIETVEEYFADELKAAYAEYLELLGANDEADE